MPFGFVRKLCSERAPARIQHGFRHVGFRKASRVHVADDHGDHVVRHVMAPEIGLQLGSGHRVENFLVADDGIAVGMNPKGRAPQ